MHVTRYDGATIHCISLSMLTAPAASRYREELDFVHRAPFLPVFFFFQSEEGSNLRIMLIIDIVGCQ